MKIAFVTQNLAPFRVNWLDELSQYVTEITIFSNNEYDKNMNKTYINITPKKCNSIIIKGKFGYNFKKIFKYNYDLLILDGYGFYSQVLLIMLLQLKKNKFGLSADGGIINEKESKLKFLFKKFLIKKASFFLSTSTDTDDFLVYYGASRNNIFRHKFTSLYQREILNKPVSNELKCKIRQKLSLGNEFTILAVGQYIYRKGFDTLILCAQRLPKDVKVIIIGEGNCDSYAPFINNCNKEKIKFVNFCDKKKLIHYYQASDLFVLPTREDIWGLVINEAISNGLPVITTLKCVAGKTLIKDNGFLVEPNDVDSLYYNIMQIYSNIDLRTKFCQKSLEIAASYSLENAAYEDSITLKRIKELLND